MFTSGCQPGVSRLTSIEHSTAGQFWSSVPLINNNGQFIFPTWESKKKIKNSRHIFRWCSSQPPPPTTWLASVNNMPSTICKSTNLIVSMLCVVLFVVTDVHFVGVAHHSQAQPLPDLMAALVKNDVLHLPAGRRKHRLCSGSADIPAGSSMGMRTRCHVAENNTYESKRFETSLIFPPSGLRWLPLIPTPQTGWNATQLHTLTHHRSRLNYVHPAHPVTLTTELSAAR